jgi:hypothetical protein
MELMGFFSGELAELSASNPWHFIWQSFLLKARGIGGQDFRIK